MRHSRVKESIFLIILVAVALFLRLYGFSDRIEWTADSARDYLVAYHMKTYNEHLLVGPTATGLSGGFYYPPHYYYFLSWILRIYDSRIFLAGLFAVLGALGVVLLYYLGSFISGKRTGAISATLYATGALPVAMTNTLFTEVVAILFFILFLFLYVLSFKKRHVLLSFLSFWLALVAGTISYAVLAVFVVFFVHFLVYFKAGWKPKLAAALFVFFCLGLLLYPLFVVFGPIGIITKFSPLANMVLSASWMERVKTILSLFVGEVVRYDSEFIWPHVVAAGASMALFIFLKRKMPHLWKLCVASFVWIFLLGVMKRGEFYSYWWWIVTPLTVLIFGHIFSEGSKVSSPLLRWGFIILFFLYVYTAAVGFKYMKWDSKSLSEYKPIAEKITSIFGYSDDRPVYVYEPNWSFWESGKLWYYFLDDEKKRFKLINYGYNIRPVVDNPKETLVISRELSIDKIRRLLKEDQGISSNREPVVYPLESEFYLYHFTLD